MEAIDLGLRVLLLVIRVFWGRGLGEILSLVVGLLRGVS